jgi:hypothetical protein
VALIPKNKNARQAKKYLSNRIVANMANFDGNALKLASFYGKLGKRHIYWVENG